MKNCLVTKLKSVVENDNLPIYGYTKIEVRIAWASRIFIASGNDVITLLNATFKNTGLRTKNISEGTPVEINTSTVTPDVEGAISVTLLVPRYITCYASILHDVDGVIDASWLSFSSDSKNKGIITASLNNKAKLILPVKTGLLENISRFDIDTCWLEQPIDLTPLGANGLLTHFSFRAVKEAFGSLDNVGYSNVANWDSIYFPQTKNVSLDIVNFVKNNRTSGRTSGSITMRTLQSITIKANGSVLTIPSETISGTLTWTPDSITFLGEVIPES